MNYPIKHLYIYAGRRLGTDKKIVHKYIELTADFDLTDTVACFTKRISACYGIGSIAEVIEIKEGTFNIGSAKTITNVFQNNSEAAALRTHTSGWQTEDVAALGVKELERTAKGEDAWFEPLARIKSAYRTADKGERAVIIAKLIQYLST